MTAGLPRRTTRIACAHSKSTKEGIARAAIAVAQTREESMRDELARR
jgi:hypothetical protein